MISAVRAWRQLPEGTRRDTVERARLGDYLTDIDTAKIAYAWSLARFRARTIVQAALVATALGAFWVLRDGPLRGPRWIDLTLFVAAAVTLWAAAVLPLIRPAESRVAAAAIRTLARASASPGSMPSMVAFATRRSRWPRASRIAQVVGAAVVVTAAYWFRQPGLVLVAVLVGWVGARARLRRLGPTVATLDAQGVHIPYLKVDAPWSQFTRADIDQGPHGLELRLYLASAEEFRALSKRARRRAVNDVYRAGGAIAIPIWYFADAPEAVLSQCWSFRAPLAASVSR